MEKGYAKKGGGRSTAHAYVSPLLPCACRATLPSQELTQGRPHNLSPWSTETLPRPLEHIVLSGSCPCLRHAHRAPCVFATTFSIPMTGTAHFWSENRQHICSKDRPVSRNGVFFFLFPLSLLSFPVLRKTRTLLPVLVLLTQIASSRSGIVSPQHRKAKSNFGGRTNRHEQQYRRLRSGVQIFRV